MIVSRTKRAGIAMGAMIVLSLSIAGFSVAQLQAGLETPSEAAIVAAEQKVRGTDTPTAITEYSTFRVPVTGYIAVSVYAREHDSAKANIFMVHGAGGGAWVWEYYFEHLPTYYNVYALSWRGHFDSSSVDDANANDYVVDQEAALAAITTRNDLPIHIIGHSYGGATSVIQAARSEVKIGSLVLLAPVVPLDYTFAQRLIVPAIAPYFIRKSVKNGNELEGTFGGMFLSQSRMRRYHELYAGHDYSTEKLSLIADDGVSPEWQDLLSTSYQEVTNRGIPVSIFMARYDNVVVPHRQRNTAKNTGAKLVEIESGHYIPLDVGVIDVVMATVDILPLP